MKRASWIFLALSLASSASWAFDKNALIVHLRKTLSLDTRTEIQVVSDPVPSGIGNLLLVNVTVGGGPYPLYFSPDKKKYIWGMAADFTVDPDKRNVSLINSKTGHSKGAATAPITVVEFSDMQCGHCRKAHEEISKKLHTTYSPDQVRLVFKHFPLTGHDWAEPAAVAAECAADQRESTFWNMLDMFFTVQEKVNKDTVKTQAMQSAKDLQLDTAMFEKCLENPSVLERVRATKKEGMALGVQSTPTLFVNGRQRRGFRDFDDIKTVIDEKLTTLKK